MGYTPWGHTELDTTNATFHTARTPWLLVGHDGSMCWMLISGFQGPTQDKPVPQKEGLLCNPVSSISTVSYTRAGRCGFGERHWEGHQHWS